MPEIVFQYPLLGRHLGAMIQVLHAASATHAEMGATGLGPEGGCFNDPSGFSQLIGIFAPETGVFHLFPHQGAFHKNGFAFQVGHPTGVMVQRFNNSNGHGRTIRAKEGFYQPRPPFFSPLSATCPGQDLPLTPSPI